MNKREKLFANLLDSQNRKWIYHPKRFVLDDSHYMPDFFLPDENLYIEVSGTRQAYHEGKDKYKSFQSIYPDLKFAIVKPDGLPYPERKKKEIKERKKKEIKMPKHALLNRTDEKSFEKLRTLAYEEKTSINQLVAEFIAEGLERRGV